MGSARSAAAAKARVASARLHVISCASRPCRGRADSLLRPPDRRTYGHFTRRLSGGKRRATAVSYEGEPLRNASNKSDITPQHCRVTSLAGAAEWALSGAAAHNSEWQIMQTPKARLGANRMRSPQLAVQEYQQSPTVRQRQVMVLVAQGLSNKQIARELNISEGTVKVHLHQIYNRLGIRKRTALATFVLRSRLSSQDHHID